MHHMVTTIGRGENAFRSSRYVCLLHLPSLVLSLQVLREAVLVQAIRGIDYGGDRSGGRVLPA